jgi:hypothetical protein
MGKEEGGGDRGEWRGNGEGAGRLKQKSMFLIFIYINKRNI